jgi:hypothetical protein
MVEQASAATEALRHQAQGMLDLVSRFRIGERAAATPQQAPRPATPAPAPKRAAIKVSKAQLPPAYAAAIAGATRSGKPDAGKGSWEEF